MQQIGMQKNAAEQAAILPLTNCHWAGAGTKVKKDFG